MGRHFLDSISCSAVLKKLLNLSVSYFPHCWRDWVSRSGSPSTYALISKSVKVHEETLEEKKLRGVGNVGGVVCQVKVLCPLAWKWNVVQNICLYPPSLAQPSQVLWGALLSALTPSRVLSHIQVGGALRLSTACGQDEMEKK